MQSIFLFVNLIDFVVVSSWAFSCPHQYLSPLFFFQKHLKIDQKKQSTLSIFRCFGFFFDFHLLRFFKCFSTVVALPFHNRNTHHFLGKTRFSEKSHQRTSYALIHRFFGKTQFSGKTHQQSKKIDLRNGENVLAVPNFEWRAAAAGLKPLAAARPWQDKRTSCDEELISRVMRNFLVVAYHRVFFNSESFSLSPQGNLLIGRRHRPFKGISPNLPANLFRPYTYTHPPTHPPTHTHIKIYRHGRRHRHRHRHKHRHRHRHKHRFGH